MPLPPLLPNTFGRQSTPAGNKAALESWLGGPFGIRNPLPPKKLRWEQVFLLRDLATTVFINCRVEKGEALNTCQCMSTRVSPIPLRAVPLPLM